MRILDVPPAVRDRRGVAALEYAVIGALVATAVAAGAAAFSPALDGAYAGMAAATQGPGAAVMRVAD